MGIYGTRNAYAIVVVTQCVILITRRRVELGSPRSHFTTMSTQCERYIYIAVFLVQNYYRLTFINGTFDPPKRKISLCPCSCSNRMHLQARFVRRFAAITAYYWMHFKSINITAGGSSLDGWRVTDAWCHIQSLLPDRRHTAMQYTPEVTGKIRERILKGGNFVIVAFCIRLYMDWRDATSFSIRHNVSLEFGNWLDKLGYIMTSGLLSCVI